MNEAQRPSHMPPDLPPPDSPPPDSPPPDSLPPRLTASRMTAIRSITSGSTASKYSSIFNRSWPPTVSTNMLNSGFQVHLRVHSISACKCISKLGRWWPPSSVSNGSGPSLWVRVRVQTKPLPNWRSESSINPNCLLGYGSMVNSQPVWIGRVVSGSPSGSIYRFI